MTITYELAQTDGTVISIFDLAGVLVYQQENSAGSTGAVAGQNNVVWNLDSSFGGKVPNGVYLIIVTIEGKIINTIFFHNILL